MFGRLLPCNLEELKLSFLLNNNWQESQQWNWCQPSAARHYKMSLERRATCAAYPYHSSTVVTTKLTIDIVTEFRLLPTLSKVRSYHTGCNILLNCCQGNSNDHNLWRVECIICGDNSTDFNKILDYRRSERNFFHNFPQTSCQQRLTEKFFNIALHHCLTNIASANFFYYLQWKPFQDKEYFAMTFT